MQNHAELDNTNLFSPKDYERNYNITRKRKKLYRVIFGKYRKLKKPKTSYLLRKILVLEVICSTCKNEDKKLFKEEESIEVLKNLGLVENI